MYIERTIIEQLKLWKNRLDRKPLLLFGARQIGKTWILKGYSLDFAKHATLPNIQNSIILICAFAFLY